MTSVKQMLSAQANRPYSVLLSQLNYDSIGWNKNQTLLPQIFKKSFRGWAGTVLRRAGKRARLGVMSYRCLFYRCAIISDDYNRKVSQGRVWAADPGYAIVSGADYAEPLAPVDLAQCQPMRRRRAVRAAAGRRQLLQASRSSSGRSRDVTGLTVLPAQSPDHRHRRGPREARGVITAGSPAQAGLLSAIHPIRQVKQAVTGHGKTSNNAI